MLCPESQEKVDFVREESGLIPIKIHSHVQVTLCAQVQVSSIVSGFLVSEARLGRPASSRECHTLSPVQNSFGHVPLTEPSKPFPPIHSSPEHWHAGAGRALTTNIGSVLRLRAVVPAPQICAEFMVVSLKNVS